MKQRYYSFNQYLREKFGERVHRISIDAGFSCPNIDGKFSKEGCIFCNNKAFSVYSRRYDNKKMSDENDILDSIREQIKSSIEFYKERFKIKKFIAYFQSFSNTYADIEVLKKRYDVIKEFLEIVGLFISTRPDCIDGEKLSLISEYKKNYLVWMEYGLQTTDNKILEAINRKHSYEDFLKTLEITKRYGINVGVHIILGLPGQGYDDIIKDAKEIAKLPIDGIKFHILHILKDTKLENLYNQGEIRLFSEEEYIKILIDFLELISPTTVIFRLISTADTKYLVAPKWINEKFKFLEKLREGFNKRNSYQGKNFV